MNDVIQPPKVSLKSKGLRMANLDCPKGGEHMVSTGMLEECARAGGGSVVCLKCEQKLTVESL